MPTISECLNIFYCQLHNKRALVSPPAIAVDAADQPFAVVVNLNERTMALGAVFQIVFHYAEKTNCWLLIAALVPGTVALLRNCQADDILKPYSVP